MSERSTKRKSGFSLLEMVIAMALGLIVLGAAVQIYIQGVSRDLDGLRSGRRCSRIFAPPPTC